METREIYMHSLNLSASFLEFNLCNIQQNLDQRSLSSSTFYSLLYLSYLETFFTQAHLCKTIPSMNLHLVSSRCMISFITDLSGPNLEGFYKNDV